MTTRKTMGLAVEIIIVAMTCVLCILGAYFLSDALRVPVDPGVWILASIIIFVSVLSGYYNRFKKHMQRSVQTDHATEKKTMGLFPASAIGIVLFAASVFGIYLLVTASYGFGIGILLLSGIMSLLFLSKLRAR
ncbi:MAG TPA: hypothetical protein VMT62_01030 [Syntrophorhabdaceae bacterium]|nr:hypothetical protein [Syntrophorhabdaceae bacterium]